jgi:autotransporter-associated beta strand protein
MKRIVALCIAMLLFCIGASAQRKMDNLDRGLVVVPTGSSTNFVSWRRLGTEYYDVTYNLYKDGTQIASNLNKTSYNDTDNGLPTSQYQVAAVVKGVEQSRSSVVTAWKQYTSNSNTAGYIDLPLAKVYDRDGNDVTSHYEPNDAEFADLDGDGELEMIIKRLNTVDAAGVSTGTYTQNGIEIFNIYPNNSKEFVVLDAYDINWHPTDENPVAATLMWRIDCGPNMVSSNSTEINIIAFDWWQKDGKAEVVLRGADNMIVYGNDGKTRLYTIGDMNVNTRQNWMSHRQSDGTNLTSMAYTNSGAEYLLYLNGETGELYQQMEYPLKRLENGENDLSEAWGDGYGHRSSKYFFGVPYLNGQEPTLFMARGIYTRHKMMVMYLDYQNKWAQLWTWNNNTSGSLWYGQGYHNFIIADVDEDGRDEIIYGSMVIDDNFQGLSTTGLGHGDAQHVGDFDPWRKGLEFFGCNEDKPAMNYRNATTSEIYIRRTASGDDGRALMDNFSNNFPGSLGRSVTTGMLSSVKDNEIAELGESYIPWSDLNFRIYWDGDLCSEILNSTGTAKDAKIDKPGVGRLFTSNGCNMNNDSKNNPCFQGDVIGDWREEIVVRCGSNVRIYTSGMETNYSIPTLWSDHQYRQAMVWQMMAYNQPPHLSYFLGEMEGYTQAPPPLITNGREIVSNGANINGSFNGKHVLHNEYGNTSISMAGGTPSVLTMNVPAWVQGHGDNNNITTETYSCNLTGGAMSGTTRLVKQGNGILNMSNAVHTNSGPTDIWGGTVNFDGTMQNSPVWMNRHTTLNTNDGYFNNGLTMEYGATLNVGGTQVGNCSRVNISELTLNYGAIVVLDVNGMGDAEHDWLNATTLNIDDSKKGVSAWENYGPEYIVPVFKLNMSSTLGNGRYPIGNVSTVNGDLSKVKIECETIDARYLSLIQEGGILYLKISDEAIANEANIEITGMAPYENVSTPYPSASSDNYYLPVVSIVANNTDGQAPTLSGTFTSLDGTVTNIGSNEEVVLFSENFESETAVSGWTHSGAPISLGSGDDGKYFLIDLGSTSTRYAYKRFSSVDISNGCGYSIEFDLALKAGNTDPGEFCVMSKGGTNPTNYWDNYASINNNANLLFDLEGSKNSTVYNINGTTTTTTLASETWYHITLNVNQSARTVAWQISNGSSGTYELPIGTSTEFDGFYFVTGRYNSKAMFDNIVIKSAGDDLSSFTFPEPGTMQVTSAVEGYSSGIKTFEVRYPYYKLYGKDFDEITGANIAEVLGSNWNTTAQSTRWAFWNKTNSIYGENYQAYWVVNNTSPIYLCNDSDPKVVWMDSNSTYPAAVMESFGVGRNSSGVGATIHVQNGGDSNTLIYYLVDNSQGNSPSTYGGFDKVDDDGSYTIAMNANYTLAKLYIYVPVSIHDELAKALPTELANGNAHLYRSGLKEASSWSTMVVPFDLTAEQAKELFGEDVVIGNLIESNAVSVRFETTSGVVYANQPFLIKNVTKDAPYLVMGITSTPVVTPRIITADFDFIGRYTYPEGGTILFNTNDYFFNTSTGLLSTVKENNTAITMKGYRAYFHAPNSQAGAKDISILFDDEPINGIATSINTTDKLGLAGDKQPIYNLQGQRVGSDKNSSQLQSGVYIMNGRKIIVK